MADSKDSLKRQNYFDLKRDEFMAMDEYLQSPISEIDLQKMNEGGVASIENMTGPIILKFTHCDAYSVPVCVARADPPPPPGAHGWAS